MQPTMVNSGQLVAAYPTSPASGPTIVRQVAQPQQGVVYASSFQTGIPAPSTMTIQSLPRVQQAAPPPTANVIRAAQSLTMPVAVTAPSVPATPVSGSVAAPPPTMHTAVAPGPAVAGASKPGVASSAVRTASHSLPPTTVVAPATTVVPSGVTTASASVPPAATPTAAAARATYSSSLPVGSTVIRSSQVAPVAGPALPVQPAATPVQVVGGATQPGQSRPHTLAGPLYTQGAYEAKHQDDPQLQNLKDLRKTSGLKLVPVQEGLSQLKAAAEDGKLSRERFLQTYSSLLKANEVEAPPDSVQNAVFDLFDRDDNNVVDMMELICGITLLCSGTEDDKIQAVFKVFDENGDGFISMDEMFKFLTSVFKVVLTPNVLGVLNSMGVTVESAEDLASVTALECFRSADLNNDGKLSIVEFKNWFYAPRNDPSFLFSPVRKLLL